MKGFALMELLILLAIGACVVVLLWSGVDTARRKSEFMVECLRDHKQYECDVLWGSAHPSPSYLTR